MPDEPFFHGSSALDDSRIFVCEIKAEMHIRTSVTQPSARLREQFGEIDVYLFDQLLRGRIVEGMKILDAGCGAGRNLIYLMRAGFEVWGTDASGDAITRMQQLAARIAPHLPADRFRVEPVEAMSFDDGTMDVIISSAVLHFARDERHWSAMVHEMWRVLAPGGMLFARLATTVGQTRLLPLGDGRYVMPDGDTRFLVSHERLLDVTNALGGSLIDPLKSTVVHDQRSMGTWVVRRGT
jgi:2-polyprenyl-3-methyl-5-hydroxy-6-metoxy-1,4-benzoquinol methylase